MIGRPCSRLESLGRAASALALGMAVLAVPPARANEPDLKPVIVEMVDDVVIPAYREFAALADAQVNAMKALCGAPNEDTLSTARAGFASLVDGFARIEAMRFGPAREDNRFEKLFFWPDRRGRGLRQVEGIIREQDETALDPARLAEKSVAVQGILALDFALSDDEAEDALLMQGSFRCGYALAVSKRIAVTAEELHADWSGPSGYGERLKNAGPDRQIYRSGGEAMQELLRSAVEMLTIVRNFKIARVIGEKIEETRIQRAPLWRSGHWLRAVDGNVAFVEAMFAGDALAGILPEDEASLPTELRFELEQARKAIAEASDRLAAAPGRDGIDEKTFGALSYAALPLHGAAEILETRLPQALGLIIGFNSLDGD